MLVLYSLIFGFFISASVSFFAYLLHALTFSGAAAALLFGTLIIGFGPWYSLFLVGFFFFSSGMITWIRNHYETKSIESVSAKGTTRDASQVLCNLLPATISLLLYHFTDITAFLIGFSVSLVGATADTWASEIGTLQSRPPRSILTGKKMLPGLSGGVSLLGTCAALIGAFLSAILFWFLASLSYLHWVSFFSFFLIPFLFGFLTMLVDSLLGATVQVCYRCLVCGQLTEQKQHHQQPAKRVKGLAFLTNDWVNLLSLSSTVLLCWWIV